MRGVAAALVAASLAGCRAPEVPATVACAASPAPPHPRAREYEVVLDRFWRDNQMPGAIVGVARAGEPPWIGARGHANLAPASPMRPCTPFRTGSITKMAVGTLVVRLAEQGAFGLDDPLVDHLPEARGRIPEGGSLTIRQLLNHSGGVRHPSEDDLGYQLAVLDDPAGAARRSWREDLEREVYDHPLRFPPGTDSHYSNGGYWLLGRLVEHTTGLRIGEALDQELFAPAGLGSLRLADGPDATLARGYSPLDGVVEDVTDWDRADSDGDPAGGLVGTAADLLAFAQRLADGTYLSADAVAEMQETTRFASCGGDCELGLGIEALSAYPSRGWGKNGSLPGVDANLFWFPDEDLTLVVFANWGAGNVKDAFSALFAAGEG